VSESIAKSQGSCVSTRLFAGIGLFLLIGCDGGGDLAQSGRSHAQEAAPAGSKRDVAVAPGAGGNTEPVPAGAAPAKVSIDNFTFNPATLEIRAGTKVVWVNNDDVPHTVRSTEDVFRSEALDTDDEFERVFSERGTYEYYCGVHTHMTGKVVVK
jgi:plastocyanin